MSFGKMIALAALLAAPAAAQSGWTTVGAGRLDTSGAGKMTVRWQPAFREMMFCADEGAVKLNEATLRFGDGRAKVLKLRAALKDMGCSKALSVGKNQDLTAIELAYDPASLKGDKAKVSLAAR